MSEVDRHWRALYGSSGQQSLLECAPTVPEFASRLLGQHPNEQYVTTAASLNNPFSEAEMEVVLLRNHNGRMPGPDGLRGELFKVRTQK